MNRRFVNLLVGKWCAASRSSFKLYRINPASLFYPAGSPKPADPAAIVSAPGRRLPSAAISFGWLCSKRHQTGWIDFMAYKNNIVAVDHEGRAFLYDGAAQAVRAMPQKYRPSLKTVSLTVGDGLYAMARELGSPPQWHDFQALVYGRPPGVVSYSDEWYWRPLPQPRFDFPDNKEDPSNYEAANPHAISSYTVVGDSQIWISTVADGAYSYDTASGAWSKALVAGLPFRGRAQYVPEHGLWFGFSLEDELRLCAADLSLTRPVVPHKVWEDPPPPESWSLAASHLLPMGSGKFCVARVFERGELSPPGYTKAERFAVLSGLEVFRAAGVENLQVIKHKSRCYRFGNYEARLL